MHNLKKDFWQEISILRTDQKNSLCITRKGLHPERFADGLLSGVVRIRSRIVIRGINNAPDLRCYTADCAFYTVAHGRASR